MEKEVYILRNLVGKQLSKLEDQFINLRTDSNSQDKIDDIIEQIRELINLI
jgi:hypothetical protein